MRAANKAIKEDYPRYLQIKQASKRLAVQDVALSEDSGHKDTQVGNVDVQFDGGEEHARLNVALNIEKTKNFKFKIFCDDLTPAPCYRFDSDGGTHRNPFSEGVTLPQRNVTTPHFHSYNEDGVEIAYKTKELIENEQTLLGDYDKAMLHFCDEENVKAEVGTKISTDKFVFGTREYVDPLNGEEFP